MLRGSFRRTLNRIINDNGYNKMNKVSSNMNNNINHQIIRCSSSNNGGWFEKLRNKIGASSNSSRNSNTINDASLHAYSQKLNTIQNPDEFAHHIDRLASASPLQAIKSIEAGWSSGKLPINDSILRVYLKAAALEGHIDKVNVTELLKLAQMNADKTSSSSSSGNEFGNENLATSINMLNARIALMANAKPNIQPPIYQQSQQQKWYWRLAEFAFKGGLYFLFAAVVISIFTEASKGGSPASAMMGGGAILAEKSNKKFVDVKGCDESKAELEEIVQYLKNPTKFKRLGGEPAKGILLTGPPGTGKTLLAKAVAGEAKVPFYFCSGSDFEEMFVGVGARRVRDMFTNARANSPSIIFIDEIDSVGGKRNNSLSHQSYRATLNQLLCEMDGFKEEAGVIVIAATNAPDILDSALLRPGRFDKIVSVPLPDIGGRQDILEHYAHKMKMAKDIDFEQISRGTQGFSGADLNNLINQAAVYAAVENMSEVTMAALEWARDKILMGSERKTAVIEESTRKLTAYHEAGHAIMAIKTEGSMPIHKATIMPRGRALGMVSQLLDGDGTSITRKRMLANMDVCMGGRVAEELIFGYDEVTGGASSDIQQASRLARHMVAQLGLSDSIGPIDLENASGKQKDQVEEEVKRLLHESYARAQKCLQTNHKELENLANGLLKYETLSGEEVVKVMKGYKIDPKKRSQKPSRELKRIRKPTRTSSGIAASLSNDRQEQDSSNQSKQSQSM